MLMYLFIHLLKSGGYKRTLTCPETDRYVGPSDLTFRLPPWRGAP